MSQAIRLETKLTDVGEPFDPDRVLHCEHWCRHYQREGGEGMLLRFNIGTYQLHQAATAGIDKERLYSSYAAAMLHWYSAVASVCGNLGPPVAVARWSGLTDDDPSDECLLYHLCAATQHVVYLTTCKPGTVRYARIDRDKLGNCVRGMAYEAMRRIPRQERAGAIQIEMDRLTTFEWRK